ncbi:MAG TPA: hypothetical protein GYA07_11775 [Verrucomicrobia bacterium]|nr:hypothetical protein [Verrucomicrobiota bacterium]HOP97756.1 hypothetical protein [Verrucomicrobiota bacterium]
MIAVLVVLGLIAAGFVIGLIATATAPVGYEDETGFHYGPEQAPRKRDIPCVVSAAHAGLN